MTFIRAGGMCPRCEGMGSVNDIDRSCSFRDLTDIADPNAELIVAGAVRLFCNRTFWLPSASSCAAHSRE